MGDSSIASKKGKIIALIMAAGSGVRAGSDIPKQYFSISGTPILRKTISAFLEHALVDEVRVVILKEHENFYSKAIDGLQIGDPIFGDKNSRQRSVKNGLEGIENESPDLVLIHDAARPFVSEKIISDVIKSLEKNDAVIPVTKVIDTIKKVEQEKILDTIDRKNLVNVQTPQGFDYKTILQCHKNATKGNFSDDASIAESEGHTVFAVDGDVQNFKITTAQDLLISESIMNANKVTKTAMGFDVHAFGEEQDHGHHIMLCGIPVVHKNELVGHSDGDVGLHAIADALLGVMCEGDIGEHFPSTDEKWKGANSAMFIEHVCKMLEERDGKIIHIDVTLVSEQPKVSPHRDAMRDRISELLNISANNVSVKATTTDRLGFLGRSEGIAAQAIATVQLSQKE